MFMCDYHTRFNVQGGERRRGNGYKTPKTILICRAAHYTNISSVPTYSNV